jgi:elongation factor G
MRHPAAPRVVALVGPQGAGKTTLLRALLRVAGADGDARPSGGERTGSGAGGAGGMTLRLSAHRARLHGEGWTLLDCPGALEFEQEARHALMVADAALVVCDATPGRAAALAPLLAFLDARAIPHLLFLDVAPGDGDPAGEAGEAGEAPVRAALEALQAVSARPLALREVPLREGGRVTGVVDLVSERAWGPAGDGARPALLALPEEERPREAAARRELLERLADLDDGLLEQLLADVVPPPEALWEHLERAVAEDRLVPVFLGAAAQGLGIARLFEALRHEVPAPEVTRARLGLPEGPGPRVQALRTEHLPHAGKQSLVRVWHGEVAEGAPLAGGRAGGLQRPTAGGGLEPLAGPAGEGEVVAVARLEGLHTGELADALGVRRPPDWPAAPPPALQLAVAAERRSDDVRLVGALGRLVEEDPALAVDQDPDGQALLLGAQGELHLREALERLRTRMRVPVACRPPPVPYRESVRRRGTHHARYKRQSGGHGQFGDVVVEVRPLPRGEGFRFASAVVGGAVPRQYWPAVEEGVREGLRRGALGFPVVDVAVTLTGGTYHSVDSSDQAFRTAGRLAMAELLPTLEPVLLEPVLQVEVHTPRASIHRAQRVVTGRRGQILGFDAHPGLPGWDVLTAFLPQAELQGLVVELRSVCAGLATYVARYDHHAELVGKQAERVVSHQPQAEG